MNIHEYQAKSILARYGVPVPKGKIVTNSKDAQAAAREIGGDVWVVKAQIHAGGRGKAGGVKIAKKLSEVAQYVDEMLGKTLVTHQTGPGGKVVNQVLIEQGLSIEQELYLGIVLDRRRSRLVVMASMEGGVEIEEVARKSPEKILKVVIDPLLGLTDFQARELVFGLQLPTTLTKKATQFLRALYKAFTESDASIAEINPLVLTRDGELLALDAKINLDDNALFRHLDLQEFYDPTEEDPKEVEASKHQLNYISLDGSIGCMVNGAGLAMATMDIIKLYGAEPANFLDVGGGTTTERIKEAFKILLSDANTKVVLVNIFGGIVHCDRVATGIIEAAKQVHLKIPLVVRLQGTHSDEGRAIIVKSGLPIITAGTMSEAAQKSVQALKERGA
ncbi:MAG: succinate--CoA ligase subunit beta [Deltaproteobacteria bacterium RIFCSPHIGHO2_12_FULL_43_9]|nr:MAG: succinate--CoA ligase subunit beta [Deltaproteobacteria bacterium RIFCSPHIGHO2_12_FULL_43_9]